MKTFNNLEKFSEHLQHVVDNYPSYEEKSFNFLGSVLAEESKEKIGWLQPEAGPFDAWQPLAQSTIADKERLGYVFNSDYNPLYRTGKLQNSISYDFVPSEKTLYLGSTDEIAIYQEFGTQRIPPRSFIGATMYEADNLTKAVCGKFLLDWICDKPLNFSRNFYGSI